jgi:hypothetical protein
MIEVEKEIEQYFINNNIPLIGGNGKSTIKLVIYGYREAGWSAQGQSNWLNKWFPNRFKNARVYTYILDLINKKYCGKCKQVKEKVDFSADKNRTQKLNGWCKKCFLKYQQKDLKRWRASSAAYKAARLNRTPSWINLQDIADFYSKCPEGHHVDHIIPLQGEKVSGLHVLENLQYLTASENCSKGNKFTPP